MAPGLPAVRAGHLFRQGLAGLLGDEGLLEGAEDVLGLGEGQADAVRAEGARSRENTSRTTLELASSCSMTTCTLTFMHVSLPVG